MSAMASQFTSFKIVYSTAYWRQIKETIKAPRIWTLWGGVTVTGEYPAQRASMAKMFPSYRQTSYKAAYMHMHINKYTVTNSVKRSWHDDVIKWKHFLRYWPFVREIHRSSVNSLHKAQWHEALMFSLICTWITRLANNRGDGDLRRHCAHYDITVMHIYGTVQ